MNQADDEILLLMFIKGLTPQYETDDKRTEFTALP